MHSTKALSSMAALAGVSLAQTFTSAPGCQESVTSLINGAPPMPSDLASYLNPVFDDPSLPPDTLHDPAAFVSALCSAAPTFPKSILPEFQSWGTGLLSYGSVHISEYDAYVTHCVTTGTAAASITSYLSSILDGTGGLCQPTATPGASSNGTISTTPAPTATGTNSTSSATTTSVVTAAAARPTGVLISAAAAGGLLGAAILL
ncbi:hypothetical protein F5Y09DRAFT_302534 [Xylaria sp. FL1042]|nr:hypothetical protein F5Y09DRAFT_302534 [Xylaria sp. FL1042]